MKVFCLSVQVLILCFLCACSKPLPDDKQTYVGEWQDDHKTTLLIIHASGDINYERKVGVATTTINAPIKEFNGNDFIVGVWFFTTDFKVTEPPEKRQGKWRMVVDGVELIKTRSIKSTR